MPRPTILCVDDESIVLDSLKEQLTRSFGRSVRIETAESGELALEVVDELSKEGTELSVVISDHLMPGIRGDELLVRIHEMLPQTRTIMLTGQAGADAVGAAVNDAKLYRYLSKPWSQDDLVLTVREALQSFGQARQLAEQRALLREMYDISLDLNSNIATKDRYARLVTSLTRVFPGACASIYSLGDNRLDLVASNDRRPRQDVSFEQHPELRHDLAAEHSTRRVGAEASATAAVLSASGPCTVVVTVPLIVDGSAIGLLTLGWAANRKLADVADERLAGFAALIAATIRTVDLIESIEHLSEQRQMVAQELQREAGEQAVGPLLGSSEAIQRLRREIASAATGTDCLLVLAAAGAGAEATARAVHDQSPRRAGPFIIVRCADSPDGLSLFGLGDGTQGLLSLAAGGTLFLENVERLSRGAQVALAEYLQEPTSGARMIASAQQDLDVATRNHTFDANLFSRLRTHQILAPSLRDRPADIRNLAQHYLSVHTRRHGRAAQRISERSLLLMETYGWPGNVDELTHLIERAVLASEGIVLEVDPAVLPGPRSLGSYHLIEEIARGGMGEVWRASHKHLARPAAIKFIRSDVASTSNFGNHELVERFRREAEATARLRSPHTVDLYDFGMSDDGDFYYVMELLDGIDLQTLVRKHGRQPPERVAAILAQLCRSLGEAHAAGLIHRDVKPANILVCRLGAEHDFVKMLDFGMVKFPPSAGDAEITQTTGVAGTPSFMAPEVVLQEHVDGRADLYCLGLVGYWLLTGRRAFDKGPPLKLMMDQVSTTPVPPSRVPGVEVPEDLEQLVLDCIAKAPSDRPPNAEAVLERLEELTFQNPWKRARAQQWWAEHASVKADIDPEDSAATLNARPSDV